MLKYGKPGPSLIVTSGLPHSNIVITIICLKFNEKYKNLIPGLFFNIEDGLISFTFLYESFNY